MMTKADFITLADALKGLDIPLPILEALVRWMQAANPNFKPGLWLTYYKGLCGQGGGKLAAK